MTMTLTSEIPCASSYEIICAEERSPPSRGYLELLAQPPRTIPYTPIEVVPRIQRTAMFTSVIWSGMS